MQNPELAYLEERDSHLPTPVPPPTSFGDDGSGASDPGMIPLSRSRLKDLNPLHFTWLKHPAKFFKLVTEREVNAAQVEDVRENLWFGDSNPAFLMSVLPDVIVAAYAEDMDAVVLLRFLKGDIEGTGLKVGDRLLSVNVYYTFNSGEVARDLTPGALYTGSWHNFRPTIADLLTDYHGRVERRKAEIPEETWERALQQAEAAMAKPDRQPRDGNPALCGWPA